MVRRRLSCYGTVPPCWKPIAIRSSTLARRAANWTCVGQTGGRGRFARPGQRVPVKAIFVYPLQRDWRRLLGAAAAPPGQPLGPADGLALDEFAANELGQAPLGDLRLSKRLVQTGRCKPAPMASACRNRLIDQPDDRRCRSWRRTALHAAAPAGRRRCCGVQDGTELNAEHPGWRRLGYIGKNKRSRWGCTCRRWRWASRGLRATRRTGRSAGGLEERKTFRWIRGLRTARGPVGGPAPGSGDGPRGRLQALFAEQRPELLVRASTTARWARTRTVAHAGTACWRVQRSSARRGTRRQSASALRAARTAQAELRWQTASCRPRRAARQRCGCSDVWERAAPALEWFLLTTLPVASLADAEQVLEWYRLRWRSRTLGHRTGQRIERAVTIKRPGGGDPAGAADAGGDTSAGWPFARHRVTADQILGGYLYRAHAPPPGSKDLGGLDPLDHHERSL